EFLRSAKRRGLRALLLIENADRLRLDVLERVCLLRTLDDADVLQIVLVGRHTLADRCKQHPAIRSLLLDVWHIGLLPKPMTIRNGFGWGRATAASFPRAAVLVAPTAAIAVVLALAPSWRSQMLNGVATLSDQIIGKVSFPWGAPPQSD